MEQCIFDGRADKIDSDQGLLADLEFHGKDGNTIPIEACFSIITDRSQEIIGLSCIFRDITERKMLEQQLARIDRLASVGELAAGVAHEIKNPLAGIAGALQILARDFQDDNPNQEIFEEVFSQVQRLDGFVNNLLQFARPSTPKLEPIRIKEVISSALFLVGSQL
jgi:two-component system sensor histidine kinase AtoS